MEDIIDGYSYSETLFGEFTTVPLVLSPVSQELVTDLGQHISMKPKSLETVDFSSINFVNMASGIFHSQPESMNSWTELKQENQRFNLSKTTATSFVVLNPVRQKITLVLTVNGLILSRYECFDPVCIHELFLTRLPLYKLAFQDASLEVCGIGEQKFTGQLFLRQEHLEGKPLYTETKSNGYVVDTSGTLHGIVSGNGCIGPTYSVSQSPPVCKNLPQLNSINP